MTISTLRAGVLISTVSTLVACATIVSGTSQTVTFYSSPEGATVLVGGKILGKTPLSMNLKKESGQSLVFEKEGYKPFSARLETSTNSWFWGNIVIGGFFGSSTDAISGAIYEYSPQQYMVTLEQARVGPLDGQATKPAAQKAKEFIVIGYNNILSDISAGEGPYLESLMSLLSVPEDQHSSAQEKIRALSEVYTEIPEFADRVVGLYLKEDN